MFRKICRKPTSLHPGLGSSLHSMMIMITSRSSWNVIFINICSSLGQTLIEQLIVDELRVAKIQEASFLPNKNKLRNRSTTSHRACNVMVLFKFIPHYSDRFRNYSGLFVIIRTYFVISRDYSVTILNYLGIIWDSSALLSIWRLH